MARRSGSGAVTEAPSTPETGSVTAPVVPPSWPAPQSGNIPHPTTPMTPPVTGRAAERPGSPVRPPVAGRPPAVGANGLPNFAAYVNQTDLSEVETDDQFKVLPDNLYVEGQIKSCDYEQGDNRNLRLVLRLVVTFPEKYEGTTIKDWVTLPDEILQGDSFNAIAKRWKAFLDACEKLSPDGKSCTAHDFREFVGEIVGFKTRNKTSQKVLETGEVKTVTYTNVGFMYYRAQETPGLQSSGDTVSVPDKRWAPQS